MKYPDDYKYFSDENLKSIPMFAGMTPQEIRDWIWCQNASEEDRILGERYKQFVKNLYEERKKIEMDEDERSFPVDPVQVQEYLALPVSSREGSVVFVSAKDVENAKSCIALSFKNGKKIYVSKNMMAHALKYSLERPVPNRWTY